MTQQLMSRISTFLACCFSDHCYTENVDLDGFPSNYNRFFHYKSIAVQTCRRIVAHDETCHFAHQMDVGRRLSAISVVPTQSIKFIDVRLFVDTPMLHRFIEMKRGGNLGMVWIFCDKKHCTMSQCEFAHVDVATMQIEHGEVPPAEPSRCSCVVSSTRLSTYPRRLLQHFGFSNSSAATV